MRRVGADDRALSEIVGALMLIVIVAVASTSFAAFFHNQQEKSNEQKVLEADRRLESFQVISIDPQENDGAHNGWDDFTFRVVSAHINPSQVMTVFVNNGPAVEYQLEHFNDPTLITVPDDEEFPWVEAREIFEVHMDVATAFGATEFLETDPIEFTMLTHRGNRFSEVFFPPTAIITLEAATSGDIILDGTRSDHVGDSGRIVRWEWDLNGAFQYSGRVVRSPDFNCDGLDDVTLTVTDNFGMTATDLVEDYVC